jgi:mevalonate kinase
MSALLTEPIDAFGKVILFGEHAVVYGYPALAVGIPCGVSVQHAVRRDKGSVVRVKEWGLEAHTESSGSFADALRKALELVPGKGDVDITMQTRLPLGAGVGSSAAFSVALAKAIASARDERLLPVTVRKIAHEIEHIFHGSPSGIDDMVATFGGIVLFSKSGIKDLDIRVGWVEIERCGYLLSLGIPSLVVGFSGKTHSTREMVEKVRKGFLASKESTERLFMKTKEALEEGIKALRQKELKKFGQALSKNHEALKELGVSTKESEEMLEIAKKAHAIGGKISGAGGGGAVVVLAPGFEQECLNAWREAGYSGFVLPSSDFIIWSSKN